VLGSKKIWCGPAQKKSGREQELRRKFRLIKLEQITKYQGINLYVKNLEDEIDEERLKKEFSAFGTIRSHKIMLDEKNNSKGFGFVCYTTPEEAQRAINEMNSRILQGCNKPLYVALHEPKEVRRQKLAQRHAARTKGIRPGPVPPPATSAMYGPAGQPMYYPPNGPIPQGFVYSTPPPGQIMPARSRGWAPTPQPAQYPQVPGSYAGPAMASAARGRGNTPTNSGRGSNPGAGGRGRGNRKNQPQQGQPGVPQEQLQQGPVIQELTLEFLAQYPFEQQKLVLGERLYPLIQKVQPKLAGKITGMLLDSGWSVEDLLSLVHEEDKLNAKIEEAVSVLDRAGQVQPGQEGQAPPGADGSGVN